MKFELGYTGVRVRNLDTSIAFYRDHLGMELFSRGEISENRGAVAALRSAEGGPILELNWYEEDSPFGGPYKEGSELDHLAFGVRDLGVALEGLKAKGHPVVQGPIGGKSAPWAYVKDPDGIWLEIYEAPAV